MILGLLLILVGVGLIMEAVFINIRADDCLTAHRRGSLPADYCLTAHRQDSLPADLPEDDDEEPDPAAEPSDLPLG